MAREQKKYICESCGAESPTWSGKCFSCGEWNTLEEVIVAAPSGSSRVSAGKALSVKSSKSASSTKHARIVTKIKDVDSVLGGGIVPGSVILIAGEPGIGKSTLLLKVASNAASNNKVLYVSGEESEHQVGLRADRLKANANNLGVVSSTSTDDIAASLDAGAHDLVVVDSIQTISTNSSSSSPGSMSQITSSTHMIMNAAKASNTAVILVGHVTKEGSIAGPKLLEHIVDVVLQLEGDRYGGFKLLRSVKNRFGSTNESAIFEMQDNGLVPVENPSEALLRERQVTDGSVVLAAMEGSRAVLVEIQALVNASAYGYPKRTSSGFDLNRLNLLVAMLDRRTKLTLGDKDIYINVVGGIKINEPAADLAICMAIGSAAKGLKLKQNAVVFGEVGLSGEVRHVSFTDKRIAEAKQLGFDGAIGPLQRGKKMPKFYHPVKDVRTALNTYLET